ncbi:hypothetical protein AAMO2058_000927800 [Amorphochlora amoebiformis]
MSSKSSLKHIPNKYLTVSEPNPIYFGNGMNEAKNPNWTNKNWLKSRFHFSFAEYYNPKNTNYGVLRVMNDDLVQPKRGFGTHPHSNAEICTYVVHGQLTHQDSMGTKESLGPGSIQFMTAGTGIRHSEHNIHGDPLRFIQMWLTPKKTGLKPNYGSMCGSKIDTKNKWGHLVSSADERVETPVKIQCDANIFVSQISSDKDSVDFKLKKGRQAYLLAVEGTPVVSGGFGTQHFAQHDAAELTGADNFKVSGPGHVLIVEMAYDGSGRSDI